MRYCFITHTLVLTDGQGRINYEIAARLVRQGHHVTVVSSIIDPEFAAHPNVMWREIVVPDRLPTQLLKYQAFSAGARRAIKSDPEGFDLVLSNGCITNYPADVNIAMFVHSNWIKSPYHTNFRRDGIYGSYQRLFTRLHAAGERREFRRASRVVALSGMVRDSLLTDVGLDPERVQVIEPGVDINQFQPIAEGEPNPLRELIGVGADAFVILFVGDLISNRKNLDLVLEGLKKSPANHHVVAVGNYGKSPYPAMAAKLGLSDRVHFIGKRTDLGTLFRGANVFAFPSHYDTFALVVTEAMASGVPVISSPNAGASTYVQHGQNGFLLRDSSDIEGLVGAFARLSSDKDFARRLGRTARHTAEKLSWETMVRRYQNLFEDVIRDRETDGLAGLIQSSN